MPGPIPDDPPVINALGIEATLKESGAAARTHEQHHRSSPCDGGSFGAAVTLAEGKLTDLATAGGCAAKYSASRLEALLRGVAPAEAGNLLVGPHPAHHAPVYRHPAGLPPVLTLHFL